MGRLEHLLGKNRPSYHELKTQVQIRNFKNAREYQRRYKEIPNAPSNPDKVYEEWEGWKTFLGKNRQNKQLSLPHKELNHNKICEKQLNILIS